MNCESSLCGSRGRLRWCCCPAGPQDKFDRLAALTQANLTRVDFDNGPRSEGLPGMNKVFPGSASILQQGAELTRTSGDAQQNGHGLRRRRGEVWSGVDRWCRLPRAME